MKSKPYTYQVLSIHDLTRRSTKELSDKTKKQILSIHDLTRRSTFTGFCIWRTINYPGASTQALCSAPTSPLTALAFRSCSRKRESGVCEFVCLCFYI